MLNIIGLKQKKKLLRRLKRYADKEVTIEFFQNIKKGKEDCIWFGGQIAVVSYLGWKFSVEALGDVIGYLYNMNDEDDIIARIKDKNNMGCFEDEMRPYLKNDKEYHTASVGGDKKVPYRLELDYNNWWEIIPMSPDGNEHDIMWVTEDNNIFSAIMEVLDEAHKTIAELQERELRR